MYICFPATLNIYTLSLRAIFIFLLNNNMAKRKNCLEQKLQGQKPSYCDDGIKPTDIYLMVLTENMLKMHWYTLISSFPLNHLKYFVYKYYRFVNALPLIHDVVVRIRQQRFVYTLATFAPADCRHDGRKAVWRESIVNAQKHAIFYSINCFETKLQSTLRCHFKRSSPLSQYSINRTCLDWLLFKLAKVLHLLVPDLTFHCLASLLSHAIPL
ncbi:hypothetical protein Tsp_01398 [Trichinella spiralis]|uniref:hypothetical protein n=1 Tax=Trichinella spiralis TaxID=6334 RepID=UPI0001EFB4C3|nr:hypothetical protein Tsp_01398 [Trichinella spiralis]